MKKLFLVLTSVLVLATSAFAQDVFYPGFQLGIKGGASHTVGETNFGKLISPAAALDLGYQISPVFGLRADISGWQGMSHEMMSWNAAHPDDQTAWTESMFGGMPTATIHASTKGDLTQQIYDFLLLGRRPATYLFISLLGAWLLMLALGIHPLIAVGGAVAVTFCSYNLQIVQVGHNTKMQALAFLPWVLAALLYTYRKALAGAGSAPAQPLFTRVGSGTSEAPGPDSGAGAAAGPAWLSGTILGAALFGLALASP